MLRQSIGNQQSENIATCAAAGRLVVFCRYPEPGTTKTRLIPALGPLGAADLHRRMTERALDQARLLARRREIDLSVCFSGGTLEQMRQWLGAGLHFMPQKRGDLGKRLTAAVADAFREAQAVVVIGSDCPELTNEILADAFAALERHDVVLGPAHDGGYYLIGLRGIPRPELFRNIDWGSKHVFSQTRTAAAAMGLSVLILPHLHDIDRPEDLALFERLDRTGTRFVSGTARKVLRKTNRVPVSRQRHDRPYISVIIPAVNEAANIAGAVESALAAGTTEVIVVDGGSDDRTVEVAQNLGARVLHSARGRGRQMNTGAAAARGDIVLFLHADTRLPEGFAPRVRRLLSAPGTAAGAFALGIESNRPSFRVLETLANFRSRGLQYPYGDQAIFLRRRVFESMGGYAEIPLMEDLDLVQRLRRMGRIRIMSRSVRTSPRRWSRHGVWKTSLLNQVLILAWWLGTDIQRLREWRESGIICRRRVLL